MAESSEAEDVVPSPCVLVCLFDKQLQACSGCYRTLDEIAYWSIYTPGEQREVLARLAARRAAG
jgi:predicted Fe-S protein YdhL (DUF1289 family)